MIFSVDGMTTWMARIKVQQIPWLDVLLGLLATAMGLWLTEPRADPIPALAPVILGVAAGLYRLAPAYSLGLVWLGSGVQVLLSSRFIQLADILIVLVVLFGTARYGARITVWLGGLSIPLGFAILLVGKGTGHAVVVEDAGSGAIITSAPVPWIPPAVSPLMLLFCVGVGAWILGLLMRVTEQSRRSVEDRQRAEAEAAELKEIAALRAGQTRLASDVHDVVGHSLAVIVAQADSVQFMGDDEIARIRDSMANISSSARESLSNVRNVLASLSEPGSAAPQPEGDLDGLIDGVRAAGNEVRSAGEGTAVPLTGEVELVAYRVLQEMLTNALKHGRRGGPIEVERVWAPGTLRIEVRNPVDDPGPVREGLGLTGMRQRLESVGGRLSLPEADGFTAAAWVPLEPADGRR
jgi:signal transduction histidine kinase